MDKIRFRPGTDSDIETCINIARGLPEYFTPSAIGAMRRDLNTEGFFVAARGGKAVGFVCAAPKSPQSREILWLAVQRPSIGQGIGTSILKNLCIALAADGIQVLTVKTLADTVDYAPYAMTRRFYEKNGFVLVDVIDPYPGWDPGNPCAIYVRCLDPGPVSNHD